MRPGEVVRLRSCELRRDGPGGCWLWEPAAHKNAWRGHKRVVLFGPRAQAVLLPLLEGRDPEAFVFSPAESVRGWRSAQRAVRKTPVQPSQRDRSKRRPRRAPGACYTTFSYRQAVARACRRAGVQPWFPLQLRHSAASRLAEQFGPEVARLVLGHKTIDTTRLYIQDNLDKAARALSEAG
jgi:integrase